MTPIRFGDMEALNLLMNNNADALVKMNMIYSSSPIARRDIGQLYTNGITDSIKISEDAKNRNVEILHAYLKGTGKGIRVLKKKK